jgi:hypothetical protein
MLFPWGERGIFVRGARGRMGLVGMRQLILSMGLVWQFASWNKRLLSQVRSFLIYYHTCVVCAVKIIFVLLKLFLT